MHLRPGPLCARAPEPVATTVGAPRRPIQSSATRAGTTTSKTPRPRRDFRIKRRLLTGFVVFIGLAGLILVLTILSVIPVRAYVMQRHDLDANRSRLQMLTNRNTALEQRTKQLGTDQEMARLALDQFSMVKPGQQLTVIPGLRSEGSVLDATRTDEVVGPAPSAKQAPKVSRVRAVLDAVQFWR